MLPIVVPSWVIPGSIQENAAFLQGKVRGIMLCAFEANPRLPSPLPDERCGLEWHVHLPVDLPWYDGSPAAVGAAAATLAPMKHLFTSGALAVLHPPQDLVQLEVFWRVWSRDNFLNSLELVLENTPESDLDGVSAAAERLGLRLCLDSAHLVLSGDIKHPVVDSACLDRVGMVHWSAPRQGRDAHAPLTGYAPEESTWCRELAQKTRDAVTVLELFKWVDVCDSWEVLRRWRGETDRKKA